MLMKKQKLQRTNKPNGLANESSIAIVFNKMHLSKWNAAISPLCLSKPEYGVPSIMKSLGYLRRKICTISELISGMAAQ